MSMFRTRRKRNKKRVTLIQRFFRTVIAVVILSTFVLGISLMVKKTATLDLYKVVKLASPVLAKFGVSAEQAGQVAGSFAERILKTNIAPSENYKEDMGSLRTDSTPDLSDADTGANTARSMVFRTAFLSDSHNNDENLRKALAKVSTIGAHSTFFLGELYRSWYGGGSYEGKSYHGRIRVTILLATW